MSEKKNIFTEYGLDQIHAANVFNVGGETLLNRGFKIDPHRGIFHYEGKPSPFHKPPWIYVRSTREKKCQLWHSIVFEAYKLFPIGCLNCWKVVVRPRNVEELFNLLDYEQRDYDDQCKCGIELRPFVHANYGGYFYNDSLEEGINCYHKVKQDVKDKVSVGKLYNPDGSTTDAPSVTLKRACTEFELKYGDSMKWEEKLNDGTWALKDPPFAPVPLDVLVNKISLISSKIDLPGTHVQEGMMIQQPGIVKVNVIQGWLEYAYAIGDHTAKKFNKDNLPFYTPSTTYHDRDETDIDKFKSITIDNQTIKREVEK